MRLRGRPAAATIVQQVTGSVIGRDLVMIGHSDQVNLVAERREYRIGPFVLTPGKVPDVAVARQQPSRLLDTRLEVVTFAKRDAELATLAAWRDRRSGSRVCVFLIHGEGGSGKTRLARRFAQQCEQEGWAIWEACHDAAGPTTALPETTSGKQDRGTLVVVDYAERWSVGQVMALLRDPAVCGAGGPARVLLLARSAGTWWEVLAHRLAREDIDGRSLQLAPMSYGPRSAAALFDAARDSFAKAMEVETDGVWDRPDFWDKEYRVILALHMAALTAVDARLLGNAVPADPGRLSTYLLRRERDAWECLPSSGDDLPRSHPASLGRAVYVSLLTGPVPYREGVAILARAQIAAAPESAAAILKDHGVLYPPSESGTVLEPLYPDRLGEDYLALSTPSTSNSSGLSDPWAADAPGMLLAPLG